jgi:uncharacterized protein (UPF0335 family)
MKTLTAAEVAAKHNATVTTAKPPAPGHNSNGQLKSYVERFTTLAEQAEEIREDTKELAKEAKGNGFDPAAIKKIVKRQMEDESKRAKRESAEAVLDTYMAALGILD